MIVKSSNEVIEIRENINYGPLLPAIVLQWQTGEYAICSVLTDK